MKNSPNNPVDENRFEQAIIAYGKTHDLAITLTMTMAPAPCKDSGSDNHYVMLVDSYRFLIDNSDPSNPLVINHNVVAGPKSFYIDG